MVSVFDGWRMKGCTSNPSHMILYSSHIMAFLIEPAPKGFLEAFILYLYVFQNLSLLFFFSFFLYYCCLGYADMVTVRGFLGRKVHHVFRADPPNKEIFELHNKIVVKGQSVDPGDCASAAEDRRNSNRRR